MYILHLSITLGRSILYHASEHLHRCYNIPQCSRTSLILVEYLKAFLRCLYPLLEFPRKAFPELLGVRPISPSVWANPDPTRPHVVPHTSPLLLCCARCCSLMCIGVFTPHTAILAHWLVLRAVFSSCSPTLGSVILLLSPSVGGASSLILRLSI